MNKFFVCNHQDHNSKAIIRILLKGAPQQIKRKLCKICLREQTLENLKDCFPFEFLTILLQNELKKLQSFFKSIEVLLTKYDLNVIQSKIEKGINSIEQQISMITKLDLSEIDFLIKIAVKSYNNEFYYQFYSFILNYFYISSNNMLKNQIIDKLIQTYNEESTFYLKKSYICQAETLLLINKFQDAKFYIDLSLKINYDKDSLMRKYMILILQQKYVEANQLAFNPLYEVDDETYDQMLMSTMFYQNQNKIYNENQLNPNLIYSIFLIQAKEYEKAMNLIQEELNEQPTDEVIIMHYFKTLVVYLNRTDEAIQICNQAIKDYPNCQYYKETRSKFINHLVLLNFYTQKYQSIDFNISELSDSTKINFSTFLIKQGRKDEALQILNQINKDSEYFDAAKTWKYLINQQEKPQQIVFWKDDNNNQFLNSLNKYLNLIQNQQYNSALKVIETQLNITPESLIFKFFKCCCLILIFEFKQAILHLKELLKLQQNNIILKQSYAIALFGDLQFSEVIVVLDEIIKITGSNEIVLELKGKALYLMSQINNSYECFKAWLSLNPNNQKANHCLGLILSRMKEYQAAVKYYNQALLNDLSNQTLLYNKGIALLNVIQQSKFPCNDYSQEALQIFTKLINFKKSKLYLVIVYFLKKQYLDAFRCAETILEGKKFNQRAILYSGIMLYLLKSYNLSINKFEKVVQKFHTYSYFSMYITSLVQEGKFEEANSKIEENINKIQGLSYLLRGYLFEKQGEMELSILNYQEYWNLFPQPYVKLAQREMYKKLEQFDKVVEIENMMQQYHQNIPLDSNYQELIFLSIHEIQVPQKLDDVEIMMLPLRATQEFENMQKLFSEFDQQQLGFDLYKRQL